ncbi:tRNA preQ1(34) S-adenosylmethionine ribosyltransferase-isomerase QueA [Salinibacter grassmerensis]|uniref:tRNA preQ1(34) S-adenosylmethionine ribosyltransferase-isomerase QueA n=1 Tax=Salinibacter grassmerensis TaxID=3040353 RepID=UPI0021E8564A|nr:tRNA preQ1(34) S-adenosylmethionine ribosyltransferase-isomerase QueA [Salinibacter grassmerensis]
MKRSEFSYDVPEELVAEYPADPPDSSRMMVLDRESHDINHDKQFRDLPEYFSEGDVLVVNDTKVYPARLYGQKKKTGADIRVFLLRELNPESRLWDVEVDPARKIRIGNKLYFDDDLIAEVIDNTTSRGRTIRFSFDDVNEALYQKIRDIGEMPLPPYIDRDVEKEDRDRYQTIFAEERGAVAAPKSTLHFTEDVLERLKEKGVNVVPITLHIGRKKSEPVDVEDLSKHRTDSEEYHIPEETAEAVNRALASDENTVTASGTTAVRALESSLSADETVKPDHSWTDLFVYPEYEFKIVERMITNFHRPESMLMMMGAAFAGYDFLFEAYEEAFEEEYRLFAFGDAIFIK